MAWYDDLNTGRGLTQPLPINPLAPPPQPAKKVRGRGGPLTAFISEAGGVGGATLGGYIGGAAGSIIPGAGTLLGAAIGSGIGGLLGGFGGKATEQAIRDEQALFGKGGSFKTALGEGAVTGLLSGLGTGISGIRAAGKAGIGAKEALKMSPKAIQEAKATAEAMKALTGTQRMLADSYNLLPNTKAENFKRIGVSESRKLTSHVDKIAKGAINPEQVAANLENYSNSLASQIDEVIKAGNRKLTVVQKDKLLSDLTKAADSVVGLDPKSKQVQQIISNIVRPNMKGVQGAKISLQGQLNFDSAAKDTVLEQFKMKSQKIAADFLKNNVDNLGYLNEQFALTSRALPFVKAAASKNIGLRLPVGIGTTQLSFAGRGPATAKIAGARLAGKAGGIVGPIMQGPFGVPLKAQGVKGLLSTVNSLGQQVAIDPVTGQPITIDQTTGLPTTSALTTGVGVNIPQVAPKPVDPRLNTIRVAIIQDIKRTGGKNLKNIQTIAGVYGIDLSPLGLGTTTGTTKLDAATKRQLAGISSGAGILDELQNLYTYAGGGAGRVGGLLRTATGKAGLSANVKVYNDARASYISRLSRALGEVGVLTDQDIARATRAVPSITDTPQEAALKFDSIRRIIQNAYNTLNQQFQQ